MADGDDEWARRDEAEGFDRPLCDFSSLCTSFLSPEPHLHCGAQALNTGTKSCACLRWRSPILHFWVGCEQAGGFASAQAASVGRHFDDSLHFLQYKYVRYF